MRLDKIDRQIDSRQIDHSRSFQIIPDHSRSFQIILDHSRSSSVTFYILLPYGTWDYFDMFDYWIPAMAVSVIVDWWLQLILFRNHSSGIMPKFRHSMSSIKRKKQVQQLNSTLLRLRSFMFYYSCIIHVQLASRPSFIQVQANPGTGQP